MKFYLYFDFYNFIFLCWILFFSSSEINSILITYLLDKYNENIGTTDGVKFSKETQELLFNINKEASEKLKEDR